MSEVIFLNSLNASFLVAFRYIVVSSGNKMTRETLTISFIYLILVLTSCGQIKSDRQILGEPNARNELMVSLADTTIHNIIKANSLIIKNSETAIKVAEPILFAMYNEENIIKQKPYEVYLIDKYWIVSGTLPKASLGGTFLIIIDATNSKIIRLTHGK